MQDAKARLANGCISQFDSYVGQLMEVAKGYPRPENSTEFKNFFRWSVDQGYVSKVQATDRFNRYFSYKYNALDKQRSIAAAVCPKLDETMVDLRDELADKKLGLQEVNASPQKYQKAQRLYYELELNLEAVCAAVADSRA